MAREAEATVVEWLRLLCAGGHRVSGSPECRKAEEEIRKGFEAGGLKAESEEFTFRPSHPHGLILHYSLLILSGLLSLGGQPGAGLLLALAALVSAYGSETGKFDLFNLLQPARRGANVVGRWNPDGARRVVVVAHYDGTRAGRIFDPDRVKWFIRASRNWRPVFLKSPFILLTLGVVGILLAPLLLFAEAGLPAFILGGYGVAALAVGVLLMADWMVARPIAAANDNGTGAAVLLAMAEQMKRRCPKELEVWLVATDAEELGLKGAAAFCARHRMRFGDKPTLFINLDTVGKGNLRWLVWEGGYILPLGLHYPPWIREIVEGAAKRLGRPAIGSEAVGAGTDGQILLRNGLPTLTLIALHEEGWPENYHWPTDVPESVDPKVTVEALEWTWAAAETWAQRR